MLVQHSMFGFEAEQHKPNERIAWRAVKCLSGPSLERAETLIKFLDGSGSKRRVRKRYFQEHEDVLSVAIAAIHGLRHGTFQRADRRRATEGFEPEQASLAVQKFVGDLTPCRIGNSPRQPGATNQQGQASPNQRSDGKLYL
jgi:hypothetical protein